MYELLARIMIDDWKGLLAVMTDGVGHMGSMAYLVEVVVGAVIGRDGGGDGDTETDVLGVYTLRTLVSVRTCFFLLLLSRDFGVRLADAV